MEEYIPGTCNIGKEEIAHRMRTGYVGMILGCALIIILSLTDAPRWLRLFLALPAGVSLAGFIQARRRFCLAYGLNAVFSVDGWREIRRVSDQAAAKADRKAALRMLAVIAVVSMAIAIGYYLLPL